VDAVKAGMDSGQLWVVVEPRSNTMRTHIYQNRLPASLKSADHVIFTPPSDRNMDKHELLDVQKVCADLQSIHVDAQVIPATDHIIKTIRAQAQPHDIVLILSNGGFENIHQRLLQSL